jgi:hypothetical protein
LVLSRPHPQQVKWRPRGLQDGTTIHYSADLGDTRHASLTARPRISAMPD